MVVDVHHRLEDEGGFADAWVTTQQNQGTGHKATAQHTVEFVVVHIDALLFACLDFGETARTLVLPWKAQGAPMTPLHATRLAGSLADGTRLGIDNLFDTGAPFATRRTFAEPLGLFAATGTAEIGGLLLCHIDGKTIYGANITIFSITCIKI